MNASVNPTPMGNGIYSNLTPAELKLLKACITSTYKDPTQAKVFIDRNFHALAARPNAAHVFIERTQHRL